MTAGLAPDVRVARLTTEQVHAMVEAGILRDGAPIELIDGLLVYKDRSAAGEDPMTIGEKHNLVIKLLARLDPELSQLGCHMQTQGPVTLSAHDEPEPDGVVLRGEPRDYAQRLPSGEDALVVIEVSDSSLEHDRSSKLALYARGGIPQYVIVNIPDGVVEVHEQPGADGTYAARRVLPADASISLRLDAGRQLELVARRILP